MPGNHNEGGVPVDASTVASTSAEFTGERSPLFRLVLKNSILTLLTLGIYRFWAKTYVRRFFWSRTRVLGTPLEYTGTPGELFLGFLIVVAVLVPFFGLYEGIGFLFGELPLEYAFWLDLVYVVAIGMLIQAAIYRMWRYRLTRTTWRGIRLGLDGSTWTYVGLAIAYWGANILCLGLLTPWVRLRLWRYRTRHSRFGQTFFSFDAPLKPLVVPWLVTYFFPIALITYAVWDNFGLLGEVITQAASGQIEPGQETTISATPGAGFAFLSFIVISPLLFVWYRVREFRHFTNHTVLGETRLNSALRADIVMGVVFLAWCTLAVIFGVFFGFFATFGAALLSAGNPEVIGTTGMVFGIIFALLLLIAPPLASIVFTRFALVEAFCKTLEIEGTSNLAIIVQSSAPAPASGEGLADAFDVGAI